MKFSVKQGFTLVELLVIVALATFVLSIIFITIVETRAKSRDARRVEDIKQIQNALSIYIVNSREFPVCELGVVNGVDDCMSQALLNDDASIAIATDPLGGASGECLNAEYFVYCYESEGGDYIIHYNLETDSVLGKSAGLQQIKP